MATTAGTFLKYSATLPATTYSKLVDIVSYPDMGSAPNMLDNSTLSLLKVKTTEEGLQDAPDYTFECNWNAEAYGVISNLAGTRLGLELDLGTEGSFTWEGTVSVFLTGGTVDEIRKMTVTASALTEPVYAA